MPRPSRSTLVLLLLAIIAVARVASTHRVFSATADEPVHIASGYDWVMRGVYIFDPEHPPLARALFGLGLRAGGVVSPPPEEWNTLQPTWKATNRGMDLLWSGGEYVRNLANARRGNLLFLIVAMVAVWSACHPERSEGTGWAAHDARAERPARPGPSLDARDDSPLKILAVALFSTLPPILAHAGLATTDMAVAAMLPLALVALERFLSRPTLARALLLGLAVGIGVASKLSFALFFVIAAAIVLLTLRRRPRIALAFVAIVIAMFVVWAAYRFEFGTMANVSASMNDLAPKIANVPMPAPTFAVGLIWAKVHEARGHFGFLLGQTSTEGWWYYFPVAVAVKTPLPFLALFLIGAIAVLRSHRSALRFVLIPIALLVAVMPISLNIGIRHVLAVYPAMAIVAAFGALALWSQNKIARALLIGLLAWHVIATALAHPDYLAWFNEPAAAHPERILGDSNLDWGQDILRLAEVAREEKIDHLSILLFGPAGFDRVALPPHTQLAPHVPVQGWIAVSETALQSANRGDYDWLLAHRPKRRVGKSIRLYFIR